MKSPSLKNSLVDLAISIHYPNQTPSSKMDISMILNPSEEETSSAWETSSARETSSAGEAETIINDTDLQQVPTQPIRLPPMRLSPPNSTLHSQLEDKVVREYASYCNFAEAEGATDLELVAIDAHWEPKLVRCQQIIDSISELEAEQLRVENPRMRSVDRGSPHEKGMKRERDHSEDDWSAPEEDMRTLKRIHEADVVVRKRHSDASSTSTLRFLPARAPHPDESDAEHAASEYEDQLHQLFLQTQTKRSDHPRQLQEPGQQNRRLFGLESPPRQPDEQQLIQIEQPHSVTDYHHQLERLEQQNKRRLSREQLAHRPHTSHSYNHSHCQRNPYALHEQRDRNAWNISTFSTRSDPHHRPHSPPYHAPPIHALKPETHYDTPTSKLTTFSTHPSKTTLEPPHSNKAYSLEAIDFIRYNKDDLKRGWEEILELYLQRFPYDAGIRRSNQCLSSRYYRDNNVPLLDAAGKAMWDEKGKLMLDEAKVRQRCTPEGKVKGVPFTLVEKHPDRAVGYEWVLEKHKERAGRILRGEEVGEGNGVGGMKTYWRKVLRELDCFRYAVIWGKMEEDDAKEAKKQEKKDAAEAAIAALALTF